MATLVVITVIAMLLSLGLTPIVRKAALRLGLSDKPDGQRKLHGEATAVGGGVAILMGFFGAIFVLLTYPNVWGNELSESPRFLIGLMVSSLFLCGVGLLDDRVSLRGRQKLAGQAISATILILSGLMIENVAILGYQIELGVFAFPFTLLWMLGAINALNLLDGVDGLATSVGLILSVGLAGMCFVSQHYSDGVLALMIAGSLAGFLYHNLPPAKIFLGDAGSMLIGLVLGALAIRSSLKGPATIALAAPTAIMAVPMFDVAMAVLRRKLTGRSLYAPDRGHIHHRIQAKGFSTVKVLLVFGLLCGLTSLGALVSVYHHNEYLALGSILAVLGTLVVTRVFGHSECLLLIRKLKQFLSTLVTIRRASSDSSRPQHFLRMQGTQEWEHLWSTLTSFADDFDLSSVQLTLHLTQIQEEFHADWERKRRPELYELWRCEIPLRFQQQSIGKLIMSGACESEPACEWMTEVISGLKRFETQLLELLQESIPEVFPFDGNAAVPEPGKFLAKVS